MVFNNSFMSCLDGQVDDLEENNCTTDSQLHEISLKVETGEGINKLVHKNDLHISRWKCVWRMSRTKFRTRKFSLFNCMGTWVSTHLF